MFLAGKVVPKDILSNIGRLFFVISTGLQEFVANKVNFKIVASGKFQLRKKTQANCTR